MARVYVSQFKNNPLFDLLYTDTDSAFTDKAIDPKIIGQKTKNKKQKGEIRTIKIRALIFKSCLSCT